MRYADRRARGYPATDATCKPAPTRSRRPAAMHGKRHKLHVPETPNSWHLPANSESKRPALALILLSDTHRRNERINSLFLGARTRTWVKFPRTPPPPHDPPAYSLGRPTLPEKNFAKREFVSVRIGNAPQFALSPVLGPPGCRPPCPALAPANIIAGRMPWHARCVHERRSRNSKMETTESATRDSRSPPPQKSRGGCSAQT